MEHSNEPKSSIPLILHCDDDDAVLIPSALTVVFFAEAKDPHYYFHLRPAEQGKSLREVQMSDAIVASMLGPSVQAGMKAIVLFSHNTWNQAMKVSHWYPTLAPSSQIEMKPIALFFHKTWNQSMKVSHCVFFPQEKLGHRFKWVWNVRNSIQSQRENPSIGWLNWSMHIKDFSKF